MMRNGDARSVVRQAAEELPDYMRGTAFGIAVDVLLADGRLRDSEERFMQELRGSCTYAARLRTEYSACFRRRILRGRLPA